MASWPLLILIVITSALGSTILEVLKSRRETTLLHYLQQTGLDNTLKNGTGPFTIFAPSEFAFVRVGSSIRNQWKNDTSTLTNILKYHIVSGNFVSSDLMVNEKMLDTLSGQRIRVNYYMVTKVISLDGVKIAASYIASNGVVHMVDRVLMHPNGTIADIIASNPDMSTLKVAEDAAGLTWLLKEGPYTLLAPTNTAFRNLGNDTMTALMVNEDLLKCKHINFLKVFYNENLAECWSRRSVARDVDVDVILQGLRSLAERGLGGHYISI